MKSLYAVLDRYFLRSSVICEGHINVPFFFPISFRTYVSLWRSRVKENRLFSRLETWYPRQNCLKIRGAHNPHLTYFMLNLIEGPAMSLTQAWAYEKHKLVIITRLAGSLQVFRPVIARTPEVL